MRTLLLPLVFATALLAGPIAITWSGQPVVTADQCPGCPYGPIPPNADAYQNGLNADLSIGFNTDAWGLNPVTSATVETPFTLTSPADVTLSLTVDYSADGTSCGDADCNANLSSWTFSGGFSGTVLILEDGTGVLAVPFGASGSIAAACDVGIECSAGYSSPPLMLSDSESGNVELGAGTYDAIVEYGDWNNSVGDSETLTSFSSVLSDPVAVPEPETLGWVSAAALLLLGVLGIKRVIGRG